MEATTIAINTLLSCPATLPLDSKGQDGAAVDICAGKQWARAGLQAGLPKFIHFVSMVCGNVLLAPVYTKNWRACMQERLGTNIGKTQNATRFCRMLKASSWRFYGFGLLMT